MGGLVDDLMPVISKHLDRELDALCTALQKPMKKFSPDDIRNFEFETIGGLQRLHAPCFHGLLTFLTSAGGDPNSNTKETSTKETR